MKSFIGKTLRWEWRDGVIELTLDREPANEIGTAMLADLEKFTAAIPALASDTAACIITSAQKAGFSAGGDLRELYERAAAPISNEERVEKMREFLEGIHAVFNAIDEAPFVTIAAIHGVDEAHRGSQWRKPSRGAHHLPSWISATSSKDRRRAA